MEQYQPVSTFLIRDLDALRIISDPLRAQIIDLLVAEPLTVKQVAGKIRVPPSKLYYHFSLLEKHGFILVVETRLITNIIEKIYRASAVRYELDRSLLSFTPLEGEEGIDATVDAILEFTRSGLSRSLANAAAQKARGEFKDDRVLVINDTARIPISRIPEFLQRLQDMVAEMAGLDVSDIDEEELKSFAITLAFYPILPGDEEGQDTLLEA